MVQNGLNFGKKGRNQIIFVKYYLITPYFVKISKRSVFRFPRVF